ncbi:hypothetical protein CEUSTIGMA_g2423.t1 [Chlamydomonas eustigma]|uniref:EGF-like domain-containing protein n=1 Tax=Chlamydomonas eustigma TaxID=1157962 RepID=A0A250WVX0_9CHLO|nr:hypothetical protein CEUSTIGMA_g2423.t1 [Chlamydomonas eustigma]|eukprot:GAX74977.1 hypothetical protein CEUSTIGMA_g2423.t1 [Chlamydomonas eustigma]
MIWLLYLIGAMWLTSQVQSQKRMGFIHLGHEVIINEPLIAGSQHLWVLSASEVRQNDLCTSHGGYLVLEWWARTQQPSSSVGRVGLMVYLDATSKEVHSGGIDGPMEHGGLTFDLSGKGSVVQRTIQKGDLLLNKSRVVIFISNASLNQSSSDPVGYSMLASCLSASMVKCPRGGSGFRPCMGMGNHYNGSCVVSIVDPALSKCACNPKLDKQDCVPMTDPGAAALDTEDNDSPGVTATLTIGTVEVAPHHINVAFAALCFIGGFLVMVCFRGKEVAVGLNG